MMHRVFRTAALWLALVSPALASQATLVTPGAPLPMASLASFLNSALLSIGSCQSGNSAPANGTGGAAFAGECWINTTSNPWVLSYTVDGTHWSEFGTLNTSTFAWQPTSNGFLASLGGALTTAGVLTQAGAFPTTITTTATTNSTLPAGTHTLAGLDVNQTFSGTDTFSGTINVSGTFQFNGNTITFPAAAATLAYLAGNQTYTGNNIFSGTAALSGGGSMAGTFTGAPTFSGNITLSGVPVLSGLSSGTCVNGLALNSSNQAVKVSCPGASSSVQVTSTSVTSAGGTNRLLTEGTVSAGTGTLADTPVTANGTGDLASVNSLAGNVISTKTQQQGGSNTATVVTPSQQQSHDSANKVSGFCTVSGTTVTCPWTYNVSSVTRSSTGQYLINFTGTPFSSANYGCEGGVTASGTNVQQVNFGQASYTASQISAFFTQATAFGAADPVAFSFNCQGRQ